MPASLLDPVQIGSFEFRNRIVISPMGQYSAQDGEATEWHRVHIGKFASGGAGLIFLEATGVERRGGSTPHDLGLWDDRHVASLIPIVDFAHSQGSAVGIQLAHAGRKANQPYPWLGAGPCIEPEKNGYPVAPSPVPFSDSSTPEELTEAEIRKVIDAWASATRRALLAGFDVVEIHGAHGYLIHQFLSSQVNRRADRYGGSLQNRMRFGLEVTETVRAVWPVDRPLFFRMSVLDPTDPEWTIDDAVKFARELKTVGVQVIDCSSGGIEKRATTMPGRREQGYQVSLAETIKREAGIPTVAVGLITEPHFADAVIRKGDADFVAIGREALVDPNWPLRAHLALAPDHRFEQWPIQYRWWLDKRSQSQGTDAPK